MSAELGRAGQAVDLGGIGKGYAGDRAKEVLRDHGIASAYANLGGNVITVGHKPDGTPWQIGIQHPRQEGALLGVLSVTDRSVVTSGDYQRFYIDGHGKRQHHILDPTTGYPAASGLISVTVVTDRSMVADVLSTALFVAGLERGLGLLEGYARAEAIFVDANLRVYVTRGLRPYFQPACGPGIAVVV